MMVKHMWSDVYDLHSHSTNSDGEHSVEKVAQLMAASGVMHWSLTDHDTIAGWDTAAAAALQEGINFIPGVEITCNPGLPVVPSEMELWGRDRAPTSWHLLAYFPLGSVTAGQRASFKTWLEPLGESRGPRMERMVALANEHGLEIDLDAVMSRADGSVGRPHLAAELIAQGYVETKQEAFDLWLGDGRPLAIVRNKPSIQDAVNAVHACGGITSLAHPMYYGVPVDTLVEFCKDAGVDAIECFHRSHPDPYRYELLMAVQHHGLASTCGSDFHGLSSLQEPGNMPLPLAELPSALKV
jgi:predicted metal-dependent phosphoesterase TrpH